LQKPAKVKPLVELTALKEDIAINAGAMVAEVEIEYNNNKNTNKSCC